MDASKPVYYSFLPPNELPEDPPNHKQCSVRGCTHPVAEESTNKMCDVCRSRHRIYASTKRARRKLEKEAVANAVAARNRVGSIGDDSAHENDSISTTVTPSCGSENPESVQEASNVPEAPVNPQPQASSSTPIVNQQYSATESHPASTTSFTTWGSIDPRLFPSNVATSSTQHVNPHQSISSSELANALTLPLPRQEIPSYAGSASQDQDKNTEQQGQAVEKHQLPEPVTSESSGVSTRFCSVKGCKAVVPDTYAFKMCPPCRTRYRTYGITKRAKWKSEREAFKQEIAELRVLEDKRRASEGLPLLADNPEELRAWESSILDEQVPSGETSSQSHTPPIRASPEPEANPESANQQTMHPGLPFGYILPNNMTIYPALSFDYSVSVSPYANMNNSLLPAMVGPLPIPARMCTVSHCHKILPGHYRFKRCEQHRLQNRHHSKLKRSREKIVKALGPEDGASVMDSALLVDDHDGNVNGVDDHGVDSASTETNGTSKEKGKEKATDFSGLYMSDNPGSISSSSTQLSTPTTQPKKVTKSREEMQKRSKFSCVNDDCNNLLTPGVRWRTCDDCRNQDRLRKTEARAALRASEILNGYPKDLTAETPSDISGNDTIASASRVQQATTNDTTSTVPQGATYVIPDVILPLGENDEDDAEGDPDIDSAGEDLQTLQLQPQPLSESLATPQPEPEPTAAAASTHTTMNTTTNMDMNSTQKPTWDTPRGDELDLPIQTTTTRPGPKRQHDPRSPNYNSLTKQKNAKVEPSNVRSVKGAFSKFRVELTSSLSSSSSLKQGPIYSGFLPKPGSVLNLVQTNSVVEIPTEVRSAEVIVGDKEIGKVTSNSQNAGNKTSDDPLVAISVNPAPQPTTSGSSVANASKEPDKPPSAPPAGQKKKPSAKSKGKKAAATNASTVPALHVPLGGYGFPTTYPYYPPYFMPPFPYSAPVVPPMTKNGPTSTNQPGPSSASSSSSQSQPLLPQVAATPQYLPYPFLPPQPPPHLTQAYGLGLGFPPSPFSYLPPRYTVPNQIPTSGQQTSSPADSTTHQRRPPPSSALPTTSSKKGSASASASASISTSVPSTHPPSTLSFKILTPASAALDVPLVSSSEPKSSSTGVADTAPFTHFHQFASRAASLPDLVPVRKKRKVDPNYIEKYRAIHGMDPPSATSSSRGVVPTKSAEESLQVPTLNVVYPTTNGNSSTELPNSQNDNDDDPRLCTRNGCHRPVSLGTLCERCKLKFKKLQAKVKRKHKLEPPPPVTVKQ